MPEKNVFSIKLMTTSVNDYYLSIFIAAFLKHHTVHQSAAHPSCGSQSYKVKLGSYFVRTWAFLGVSRCAFSSETSPRRPQRAGLPLISVSVTQKQTPPSEQASEQVNISDKGGLLSAGAGTDRNQIYAAL